MDRGAWWAIVHDGAKESDMTEHTHSYCYRAICWKARKFKTTADFAHRHTHVDSIVVKPFKSMVMMPKGTKVKLGINLTLNIYRFEENFFRTSFLN